MGETRRPVFGRPLQKTLENARKRESEGETVVRSGRWWWSVTTTQPQQQQKTVGLNFFQRFFFVLASFAPMSRKKMSVFVF